MGIPVNGYYWLMSIVPIFLLMFMMGKLNWGAAKAAPLTLLVGVFISIYTFKANFTVLNIELLKAVWSSVSVVLVIFTALLLYEVSKEAEIFKTLYQFVQKIAPNELIRILLIGVCFSSFLQGFAGFGVPVLVTAPLLLQMGILPYWAVIIPLLGHAWGGTYGTFALAWNAMIDQLTVQDAAFSASAGFYAALFLGLFLIAAHIYIVFSYGGWRAIKKGAPALLVLVIIQGGGQIALASSFPELASFLPSVLSLGAFILLSKSSLYNQEWSIPDSKIKRQADKEKVKSHLEEEGNASITQALLPYILIITFSLPTLLFSPLSDWLIQFSFGPFFKETTTGLGFINPSVKQYSSLNIFKHAGFFLFLSALLSFWYYQTKGIFKGKRSFIKMMLVAAKKALYPSIAIMSLMGIARVMTGTGQTEVLAEGMSSVLKDGYVYVAPSVGMVGSFLTGGNMASNILFGNFQYYTAQILGLNPASVIGAQTAAGALGMIIAPNIIVVATTTVGLSGKEGQIIIKLLPFVLSLSVLMGIVLALLN